MLVCAFVCAYCTRDRGCSAHPVFPAPSVFEEGQDSSKPRAYHAARAQSPEAKLCCPVDYYPEYLKVIPQEVIDRDYGCGDPSQYLREGETVLEAAARMGYRPNLMARNLASRRTMTLGLLLNDLHNQWFAEIADGIHEEADSHGYRIILGNGRRSPRYEDEMLATIDELIGPDIRRETVIQDIAYETTFDGASQRSRARRV